MVAATLASLKQDIELHFSRVLHTKTSPHAIALGFSVGTAIAILPTPGFSVVLGFLAVLIYPKLNKFALFTALALWNPLLSIPINAASYSIGDALLGSAPVIEYEIGFLDQIIQVTKRFLIGNLLLATTLSSTSYVLVKLLARRYYDRLTAKLI